MNPAKIRLSPTEKELVNSADMILTKNGILRKVMELLGILQSAQQDFVRLHVAGLPQKISRSTPKISKGENYKGLPYLILDYPRIFENENLPERQAGIFAVRTMFWWGNFFSVTLHLSGMYKIEAEEKLIALHKSLQEKGYYWFIHDDQWEHHFGEDHYLPLDSINPDDFEKSVRTKTFIKLANKISLQQWDEAPAILFDQFREIMKGLADQPPSR